MQSLTPAAVEAWLTRYQKAWEQRDIHFKSKVIAVNGQTAVARWSVSLTSASSGARIELDGVFVLEFENANLCRELREWWHVRAS